MLSRFLLISKKIHVLFVVLALWGSSQNSFAEKDVKASSGTVEVVQEESLEGEETLGGSNILARSLDAGPVVFFVLLLLISLSVMSWAVAVSKWRNLKELKEENESFIKSFWESRSLNDLNNRLGDFPYSPVREVFRAGYSELVRASQMKEQTGKPELALKASLDNLSRTLHKSKNEEKRKMESRLPILAISASASPFIGLFGTVWGIMSSFEEIARTGSSSLAAVAPGISEALIATAFGLAAAIPAVIGYNIAMSFIRNLLGSIDGFGADYLNIVERYLVSDSSKSSTNPDIQTPRV